MRKQYFLIIIIFIQIFNMNCSYTPYHISGNDVLLREKFETTKAKEITKGKHGFISIHFPEYRVLPPTLSLTGYKPHEIWGLHLYINNEEFFYTSFFAGEIYTLPVPTGKIILKYQLHNDWEGGSPSISYRTGDGIFQIDDLDLATLTLEIEESKIVNLKIVKSADPRWGVGCCVFFPIPMQLQDVNFEATLEVDKDSGVPSAEKEKVDAKE